MMYLIRGCQGRTSSLCKLSLRGYEAAIVLTANGWTNVKVMEGGIAAWPYAREK